MDPLLQSLREASVLVLPTLGALVLIFLLVLLKRVLDLLKRVNALMDRVNSTLDVVDKELAELQESISVLSSLARGIVTVQNFTKHSVTTLVVFFAEYAGAIKEWLKSVFDKHTPNPEDTDDDLSIVEEDDTDGV